MAVPAIVVMTGGGIKGAVAAARYASDHEIIFFHADYGQPSASRELQTLHALAESFPAARPVALDLPHVRQLRERLDGALGKSRTSRPTRPDKLRGSTPTALLGLMPVLIATAVQCAIRAGAPRVVMGLTGLVDAPHLGLPLPEGQPGRRREFVHAFNIMIETLSAPQLVVRIEAPLINLSYTEIVKLALHFQTPFEKTWTCWQRGRRPCAVCGACRARAAAFTEVGLVDPLNLAVAAKQVGAADPSSALSGIE